MNVNVLEALVAHTLGIAVEAVTPGLAFGEIPEWDSVAHVSLMLALESAYGKPIDEDQMVSLTTVAAIRAFVND